MLMVLDLADGSRLPRGLRWVGRNLEADPPFGDDSEVLYGAVFARHNSAYGQSPSGHFLDLLRVVCHPGSIVNVKVMESSVLRSMPSQFICMTRVPAADAVNVPALLMS